RLSGLSYTAGVLVFVGLVAGALIALKAAGEGVGWGFQLQSPAFVAVMALVVFTLGLGLSGVFSIGGSMMGWGSGLTNGGDSAGVRGSFLTGALAALVATPCTAPFMGVALGVALTQPWPVALAIFLALGLGLALPYLVLTFLPGTAHILPRPGPWMERVKQVLAFPLYLTAAWLVWVLALQAGAGAAFAALVAMVLAAFAAWLFDLAHGLTGSRRGLAGVACLAAGIAAVALAVWPQASAPPLSSAEAGPGREEAADPGGLAAEPFSFARLNALRAEGTPAFVNLTAAWCITCQVNERLALSSARVAEAFRERGVVYLKGDWTNRDPEITRLLDSFGRSGVPLYLFYSPGSDRPEILPQFLTESIVIRAIEGLPAMAGDANRTKGSG
ncbi:MAG: protein-disulfide reductase DsbD family protein, partial [Rhodospirillales bacterium]